MTTAQAEPAMAGDLRAFHEALNREERILAERIATDEYGLVLRVAINEQDLDFDASSRRHENDVSEVEASYLMRLGVSRIVKLSLEAHARFIAPTLTMRRDANVSLAVLRLVREVATVEHGRRLAQSIASGLGRVERAGLDRFVVTLPRSIVDAQFHEKELDRHFRARERRMYSDAHAALVDAAIGEDVRRLLHELVRPFADHFIGYDSDPKLDSYFFAYAYSELQISEGFDTFHYATRFGGMTFQNFKLAATFVLSAAIRHRVFVDALLAKSPTTRMVDILTVSAETPGFLDDMRAFINWFGAALSGHEPVTEKGARLLLDVLSVGRHNTDLLQRPGAPFPPLVQCSDGHVIKPLAGAGSEIMLFLLNSLRHAFTKEYDRAQRGREAAMQAATKRLLRSVLSGLEFRDNIKLRRDGRLLTDIDLAVIEIATGRVVLIQLKHQDPFGSDLAAMRSRTSRLDDQAADWLARTRSWIADTPPAEIRSTLRLPKSSAFLSVDLLVLARHYAFTLRRVVSSSNESYANWNQFAAAIEELRSDETGDPDLGDLLTGLKALGMSEAVEFKPEPPREWRVGTLVYEIVGNGDARESGFPAGRVGQA